MLRRNARGFGRLLAGAAIAAGSLTMVAPTAHAATTTFVVNSLDHQVDAAADGACDTGQTVGGIGGLLGGQPECTLYAALQEANALAVAAGNDIAITFADGVEGNITLPNAGPLMDTQPYGAGGIDFTGLGAFYKVDAKRPVTIDFGKKVGLVSDGDAGYTGIYIKSNNVAVKGFTNIRAGESAITTGATNVAITDGVCTDKTTNWMEACVSLLDGATNIVIDDLVAESMAGFPIYVDDFGATITNVSINAFDPSGTEIYSDIWFDDGRADDPTTVNGFKITNSRFRNEWNADSAIRAEAFAQISNLTVKNTQFLGTNDFGIWMGPYVDTQGLTVTDSVFRGTRWAFRDEGASNHNALVFRDNTFDNILEHALEFVDSKLSNSLIEGNTFKNMRGNALTTVYISQTGTNNVVRNNTFLQEDLSPNPTFSDRWAIFMNAPGTADEPTGWSFSGNSIDGYLGVGDAPITIHSIGITPADRNTFGTRTTGSVDPNETEVGARWFVANRNGETNNRIQTWRPTKADFTAKSVTVTVRPVDPELSNNQAPSGKVDIDVYWTAKDNAERYLGRIEDASSSATKTFATNAGTGFVRVQTTDSKGNTSQYSSAIETVADVTPPPAPVITEVPAAGPVRGTAEPAGKVEIKNGAGTVVCSANVGGDGGWSCNPTVKLTCGNVIYAVVTDGNGNVSARSKNFTIAKDCAAREVDRGLPAAPDAPSVSNSSGGRLPRTGGDILALLALASVLYAAGRTVRRAASTR